MGRAGHAAHQVPGRRTERRATRDHGGLAEEYSDGIAHVTTRQDFQLHYIHIEDTPGLMRRLAAVEDHHPRGVRQFRAQRHRLPAMPASATDEVFDVTPYARALMKFLLGHPDCQDFGRKFKPASPAAHSTPAVSRLHDLGLIAASAPRTAKNSAALRCTWAAASAPCPYHAKLFDSFVPVEELLPLAQSIARVFAKIGEKKNRNRARIKFLVQDLGIEKFRQLVLDERKTLAPDPRWTDFVEDAGQFEETPLKLPALCRQTARKIFAAGPRATRALKSIRDISPSPSHFRWATSLPTSFVRLRTSCAASPKKPFAPTVEQNFVIRWVSKSDLLDLYNALKAADLAAPGAGTIVDIVTCPGTDTCKLGISSSRGLAGELRKRPGGEEFPVR